MRKEIVKKEELKRQHDGDKNMQQQQPHHKSGEAARATVKVSPG